MANKYILAPSALQDLRAICEYIAEDNLAAADKLQDRFIKRFKQLASNPFIARSRPDIGKDLRSTPLGNYIIICKPVDTGVRIARVFHASRDYKSLLKR